MSSHCVSIWLLVLLGAVLTSGASFQFISEKLKQDHDFAARALKLTQVDVVAEPLFSSVIRSNSSSCQRRDDVQLMSVTLDIYTRIFSRVLREDQPDQGDTLLDQVPLSQRAKVEDTLQDLQQKMEMLKRDLKQMNQGREEVMAQLMSIKVDDVLVQKKALAEVKAVFQAASLIGRCGHAPSV